MPTTNGAKRIVTTTTILAAALIPAMPASAA